MSAKAKPKTLRLATLDGRAFVRPGCKKRLALAAAAFPARSERAFSETHAEARHLVAIAERSEAVAQTMLRACSRDDAIVIAALARESAIEAAYVACRVRNLLETIKYFRGSLP